MGDYPTIVSLLKLREEVLLPRSVSKICAGFQIVETCFYSLAITKLAGYLLTHLPVIKVDLYMISKAFLAKLTLGTQSFVNLNITLSIFSYKEVVFLTLNFLALLYRYIHFLWFSLCLYDSSKFEAYGLGN